MNLIIGNTSQQSYYYPEDYIRVSSHNIDFNYLRNNKFDSVYITFAEQRIYEPDIDYITPNFTYTMKIIDTILDNSDKIVIYMSCELWSNRVGVIDIKDVVDFKISNKYTVSKFMLLDKIKTLRLTDKRYEKVIILYPFYFNSAMRSKYFLFGKIFDSIINEKKIDVGNLNFYRDMVHTKFLVKKSIESYSDVLIGSGKFFNVRDFIMDLYSNFNMDYHEFVTEDKGLRPNDKLIRANVSWSYEYKDLLDDTISDLKNFKNK